MAIKKSILRDLVIDEATNLKKHATKDELENLNFFLLDPTEKESCVYGQMTGHCENYRSKELIVSSCIRVFIPNKKNIDDNELRAPSLNGKPKIEQSRTDYYSPIEVFIWRKENQKNGNNKRLIRFLKGKTKTLKFV